MTAVSIARVRRAWVLSLVVASAACAGIAHADVPKTAAPAGDGATAEDIANEAFKAYEANDFASAVDLYLKAFQVSGDARLLYNVASIFDKKLQNRKSADEFYRRYLKSPSTEPELVKKATDRLADVKREKDSNDGAVKAPATVPGDKPPAPPPSEEPPLPLRTVGLVAGAIGIVSVGVGTVFGLSALGQADDLKSQCPNAVCQTGDGRTLRDDASTAATLSTVFLVGGLVIAAGGAAMYFLAPETKADAKTRGLRVRPAVNPAHAGVVLSGTF